MMGASSDLFNAYNVSQSIAWTFPLSPIYVIKEAVNSTFFARQPDQQIDIAAIPNPFFGVNNGTYEDSMQTQLRLLDGTFIVWRFSFFFLFLSCAFLYLPTLDRS